MHVYGKQMEHFVAEEKIYSFHRNGFSFEACLVFRSWIFLELWQNRSSIMHML